jgi:hypothetical protein
MVGTEIKLPTNQVIETDFLLNKRHTGHTGIIADDSIIPA